MTTDTVTVKHTWRQEGTIMLRDDERIDDLQRNHYGIIQRKGAFCFGMDAVLLSGFAVVKKGEKVLDLGTGTGIIPILLTAKTEGSHFTGLEIQEESADMARRSVAYNHLEGKVDIVTGDLVEASRLFALASFDVVTANPPYMNESHGLKNPGDAKAIARHEVKCTLEDVVREGTRVLKPGGRFCMVHRPRRLIEIKMCIRDSYSAGYADFLYRGPPEGRGRAADGPNYYVSVCYSGSCSRYQLNCCIQ